jgi:hypothetical protein
MQVRAGKLLPDQKRYHLKTRLGLDQTPLQSRKPFDSLTGDKDPDELAGNYSGLGAFKDRVVRNLFQLEKVSEKAPPTGLQRRRGARIWRTGFASARMGGVRHPASPRLRGGQKPIVGRPTHFGHATHPRGNRVRFLADLFLDLRIDSGFPLKACTIRRSSMRCKYHFRKSISRVCCPILRSWSACGVSSLRGLPGVARPRGELTPPAVEHIGGLPQTRAPARPPFLALTSELPPDNPMTQFSIQCKIRLFGS